MAVIPEITLRLTPKGIYYWSIKVFPAPSPVTGSMPTNDEILASIKEFDTKLCQQYPSNGLLLGRSVTSVGDIGDPFAE